MPSNYIDALLDAHDERSRLNDSTLSGSPTDIRNPNEFVSSDSQSARPFQANNWTSQFNPSTFERNAYAMTVPGTFANTAFAAMTNAAHHKSYHDNRKKRLVARTPTRKRIGSMAVTSMKLIPTISTPSTQQS